MSGRAPGMRVVPLGSLQPSWTCPKGTGWSMEDDSRPLLSLGEECKRWY